MSLCLVMINDEEIYIGSDTRECATLGLVHDEVQAFWMNDEAKKLHVVGNKILFLSGITNVCLSVIDRFKASKNHSIQNLQRIACEVGEYFEKLIPNILTDNPVGYMDISIVCTEKGKQKKDNVFYNLNSLDGFKILKYVAYRKGLIPIGAGFHNSKAVEMAKSLQSKLPIDEMYIKIYESLTSEKIGGRLELYKLNSNREGEFSMKTYPIRDSKKLVRFEDHKQLFSHYILGQRVSIGDENGIWLTEGPKTTITDRYGREAMKFGLYEENPDMFGMVINRYDGIKADSQIINKVIANSEDGFKIQQFNGSSFVDKFYVDNDGLLFAEDMTTKRLKIVSDTNELLLDSFTKFMDIGKFDKIVTDGKLTSIEKLQVLGERTRIISEYQKLLAQANSYKTTSRDESLRINPAPFTATYNALIVYLGPLLVDMNATVDIDRNEFIQKFKAYYDEVTNIINAINDSIKYSSLQLGTLYNNVVMDAQDGILVTRSDAMYRSVMNAIKGFAIQKNTNTADNPVWVDQFWADTLGIIHAEGIKINNSLVTNGGIEGAYIILRDSIGGVMKLYPSEGFWAGNEIATLSPTWIKPDGTAIFKKLIVKNGEGGLMIDSENKFIDMNSWDLKGAGAINSELISANIVSADFGFISDLTANRLSTMTRSAIGSWANYINIEGNSIQWITGIAVQGTHKALSDGRSLYWSVLLKQDK